MFSGGEASEFLMPIHERGHGFLMMVAAINQCMGSPQLGPLDAPLGWRPQDIERRQSDPGKSAGIEHEIG